MKQLTAGFIGCGNMGGALASAVSKASPALALYDTDEKRAQALSAQLEGSIVCDAETAVREGHTRFLFLAVKPNVILQVARKLPPLGDTVLVTMAAGISIQDIASAANTHRVIRIMPNTPAKVGSGMILYCPDTEVTAADEADFIEIMRYAGVLDKLPEKLIDAAAALSGCGPAYAYMFAEALADGAVRCGLPRDKAMFYAAQMLRGSADMLLGSGEHPGALKDAVCSPGGTTIEGVLALERAGFRGAASDAVIAAYEKTAALKK